MAIYAISDLHLALDLNKPMNIFGCEWENHHIKIKENWNKLVSNDDLVLVSGDISWAMNLDSAKKDLDFIEELNGSKILGYGNHDFWWNSTNKLNEMYNTITFLRNSSYTYKNYIIVAVKGSVCPRDTYFTDKDEKLYKRETKRLESALSKVFIENDGCDGDKLDIIVMLHYPPTNDTLDNSLYLDILKKYNVKTLVYGHLHNNFDKCLKGNLGNIEFFLTSSDYLNFEPVIIKK